MDYSCKSSSLTATYNYSRAKTIKEMPQERRNRLWSQEDVARLSGLGVATVRRIESGKSVKLSSLLKYAEGFGYISDVELVER